MHGSFGMGMNDVTLRTPGSSAAGIVNSDHAKFQSRELPLVGRGHKAPRSCQFCAMQRTFALQCRMAGLGQTLVPAEERQKSTFGGIRISFSAWRHPSPPG